MYLNRPLAAGRIVALAAIGRRRSAAGRSRARPRSPAPIRPAARRWQIRIDYRSAAPSIPIRPASATRRFRGATPRTAATTRSTANPGDLTVIVASSTGGYFLYDRCRLENSTADAMRSRAHRAAGRCDWSDGVARCRRQGKRRLRLGDRAAQAQRGFRRRRFRLGAARAAPRRGGGDRRRHRRRQGRPRRGRDRGARLSRRVLRPARDHGSAARRGHDRQRAQRLDPFPGPPGSRAGGDGMHLHRAGAARPRRPSAACRRHARLPAERRPPDLPDHRSCAGGRHRPVARPLPRAGRRGGSAPRLCQPAGGAARPLPAVQRRRARLPDRRDHRRHPARALRSRGHRPRAGRGRARSRQHRQLHGPGAGRGRAADGGIGRHRRRHHATAADPGADRRRDGRWFRAQGAGVRRPLQPPVRRRWTRSRAARWC